MRILHVTDHFPPTLGGIEAHVAELAARQAQQGHAVTVLTCADPQLRDDGPPGVEVVRVRSRHDVRLRRDPDVVHAHLSVVAPFTAPVAARLARRSIPTITTVHSMWGTLGPLPGWAASLSGLASSPVAWTAVSGVAARGVSRQLRREVGVLPNAVDVAPRPATPTRAEDASVRLVTAMRLACRKRPIPLVDVLADVAARSRRPVSLTVLGDGPLQSAMQQRAERHGVDGLLRLAGRVTPAEVAREVAAADVYVAPARWESFGLAALEARGIGLPVVGCAGSGLVEFVDHGRDGFLVADDAAMADALLRLVDDAPLRRRIAEHNRTVPPGFTWVASLRAHDAAYASVLRGDRTLVLR